MRFPALFITCALSAGSLYGFDLDSLLIKSIGGAPAYRALGSLAAYTVEGNVRINDMAGRFTEIYMAPNLFYLELDIEDFNQVQAYDGRTAWQRDQNGHVTELSGFEKKELLATLYFESFSFLTGKLEGSAEYLGETTFEDARCHEVAFYPLYTDTVWAYFDVESGLKKATVSLVDNMKSIASSENFDTVGNIVFTRTTTNTIEGVSLTSTFVVDKIELNGPVSPSIFAMPVTGAADYRFPVGKDMVLIPVDYSSGHLRLTATVNGSRKTRFILDSGTSVNILDKADFEGLNLPAVGTIPTKGLGGYDEIQLVRCDSVAVGDLTLYGQVAGLLDLSALDNPPASGGQAGGLLGYDFLSRFPLMIDYRNSILTVFNPDGFNPPDSGVEIPFRLVMQIPTVRGELVGIAGDFIIDLGNPYGLILHRSFVDKNRLEARLDNIADNAGLFGGIGGALPGKTAYAATFKIGDVLIQSLRVVLPEQAPGISGSEELAGSIGNLVLEKFRVLFDYRHSRLILYDADK
ncbi:MAG: retroviral-like aspartic protease family protein [candidate division Zixibacteria bacterium]|nr:retroviral-like aspartic protease family protein [candidate division Zixibacteria bacterium]